MPSCAYRKCRNNTVKTSKIHGVTFHSFPRDELIKQKWTLIVKKQRCEADWVPTVNTRLCSNHFKQEDFYTTIKGYKKLTKEAMPFILDVKKEKPFRSGSPNSLSDVSISDLDSIFESPIVCDLRKKLNNAMEKKRKAMEENHNLKKKNKRLDRRCAGLQETILSLKKKILRQKINFDRILKEHKIQQIMPISEDELPN